MSIIKSGCLVMDIGAHIGTTVEQFHNAGAGKIIAVEPCFENFQFLRYLPYVTPVHAACWNYPTITEIFYAKNQSGLSSVRPDKWSGAYPDTQWAKAQTVPCITLDQLIEKFGLPHFVKVDVEGVEYEVLLGLTKKPQYLSFEFHGHFKEDVLKCFDHLKSLGFKRAHYTVQNMDIETLPTTKIDELIARWQYENPQWGNIIVR